ncbi:hypothetical protein L914_15086 [Phytophthora nicotianae]|uniref:Uncharacterized protein n=1 Tax=Phytophthora nicotianae TaxID=4792 RepID=W2MT44_PHYNI|nr:hypothetical protein L914_15086 [Phytophthora nicotianae]
MRRMWWKPSKYGTLLLRVASNGASSGYHGQTASVKTDWPFYVRLIWEFQGVVEKRMKTEPNEKGVRAFSLFPISTTYTASHIKINGTTLAGFYLRIKKREKEFCWQIGGFNGIFSAKPLGGGAQRFDISRFETRSPQCPLPKPELRASP